MESVMANPTQTLLPSDLWADVLAVRAQRPLVHSITNLVVMNFNANVLLAMGASPVMAHAHEEVTDMAAIAQALVLNIGTLEPYWIKSMCHALDVATARGIPTVLDPVGAGATRYRNESIQALMRQAMPTVIRGNASEIMSVAGLATQTRGVDSSAAVADALIVYGETITSSPGPTPAAPAAARPASLRRTVGRPAATAHRPLHPILLATATPSASSKPSRPISPRWAWSCSPSPSRTSATRRATSIP